MAAGGQLLDKAGDDCMLEQSYIDWDDPFCPEPPVRLLLGQEGDFVVKMGCLDKKCCYKLLIKVGDGVRTAHMGEASGEYWLMSGEEHEAVPPPNSKTFPNACLLIRYYQRHTFTLSHPRYPDVQIKLRSDTVLENQPFFVRRLEFDEDKYEFQIGEYKVKRWMKNANFREFSLFIGVGEGRHRAFRIRCDEEDRYWLDTDPGQEAIMHEWSRPKMFQTVMNLISYYQQRGIRIGGHVPMTLILCSDAGREKNLEK